MRISCIIPIYNAEKYLEETLQSVLSQDGPLHEVIAVDDGSSDGSMQIARRHEPRVTVVGLPHAGISAARNAGLRRASGDAIAFQDADDLWPPRRLKALAQALESEPSVQIVGGLVQIQDERQVKPQKREDLATKHRPFSLGSLLIRRAVFEQVGFFNENLTVVEDTEFIMRVRRSGLSVKLIDEVTLIYRWHEANISRDIDRNQSNTLDALRVISRMRREQ